ncbi:MAG TPA: exonuclease domain-containing protein [Patescibacteria group bacterium]|jgi:DNA polymerase III epsilon subunit-like protein|nr:exonuclease domain-containing protein [Patescibacteria group bacterium]
MKFIKDILLFQIETTGQNIDRDSIIQLSAVLLDKDNLLEKNFYNSYVKVSFLDNTIVQHADMLQVPFETLQKSHKLYDVIKEFVAKLGATPLLATHSVSNVQFLRQAFKKTFLPYEYDSHVLDLWSLGYVYTLHYGIKKMPTMQTLFQHFNLKQTNPHDALEKARLSAEVFRKIVNG